MSRAIRLFVLPAILLVAACSARPVASPAAAAATVSGSVTYAGDITLPAGAVINVALVDVTNGANTVLGTQQINPDGNTSPIPFEIGYSKSAIIQAHEYVIEADVTAGGQKLLESATTIPVITRGNPVQAVQAPLVAAKPGAANADVAAGLVGKVWALMSLGGNPPLPNSQIGAVFTAEGNLSGFDGCNTYVATYQTSGSSLTITPGAQTMVACAEDVSKQSKSFLDALTATASYEIDGNELRLINADGKTVATFQAAAQELAGTAWNVVTFNNGKQAVVSSAIPGVGISFGSDGMASGFSGCNTFTGSYTASGNKLAIGPLATTRKACTEPKGAMEAEAQYLAALQAATNYQVQGQMLSMQLSTGETAAEFAATK